ncbi:uncharacterized protein HGUI_03037 [Hanseniaspora guilliermondii]|uniref:DNA mismatch repair proteins mutS family domain-containing protein n=1 Tax=Hanseniaspora guilliermondii TaxID=56406 RepID=A0A1L0CPG6_9ASCO|nr:uncharacterized protein HGUI_03037 [Hanseniaspora guilliermondii]
MHTIDSLSNFSATRSSPYFKTNKKVSKDLISNQTKLNIRKRKRESETKLNPLDEEILKLKLKYPQVLIVVEYGYTHRLYCEDGRIAAKILKNKFTSGRASFYQNDKKGSTKEKFAYCTINSKHLNESLIQLVSHNYKVLLFKQSNNTENNMIARYIEKIISLTTFNYINETIVDDLQGNSPTKTEYSSLLCIYFDISEDSVQCISFLELDLKDCSLKQEQLKNEMIYDESYFKSRFRGIMGQFQTIEIVTNKEAPYSFLSILNAINPQIRVYKEEFLFDKDSSYCAEYQLLHQYLKDYNLQHTLEVNYGKHKKDANDNICKLSNNIINHLNMFSNKVTKSEINTLWGLLNNQNILTSYGKDKLMTWIKNPLVDIEDIRSRNEAIVFFSRDRNVPIFFNALKLFFDNKNYKNIARINSKIKISPKSLINRRDIYFYLSAFRTLKLLFKTHSEFINTLKKSLTPSEQLKSTPRLLKKLIICCESLINELSIVDMLDFIDRNAVFSTNLEFSIKNFFILSKYDRSEHINKIERDISLIEEKKMAQLEKYKNITGKPYLAFHENKFEIILRTSESRGLPENWRFLNRITKNKYHPMNLYRAPETDELEIQLEEKKKELLNVCDAEYRYFLERLNTDYNKVYEIIDILASIDSLRCLGLSTSHFSSTPIFVKESGIISLEDAHNPMLDYDRSYLMNSNTQNIPNTINLRSDKLFILTGLNAGGKTTVMKKVAYLCILAQIGCNTPCLYHKQSIFTSLDIRTGSSDSIITKTSTFLNEMLEYKEMLENSMCERSLVLLDEIGRGTSHIDGTSLTYAFLKDLKEKGNSKGIVMFVTHYHDLLKNQTDFDADEIYKMGFHSVENGQSETLIPTFKLQKGIGESLGIELAKVCGFDDDVLDNIDSFKYHVKKERAYKDFYKFIETEDTSILKRLMDYI